MKPTFTLPLIALFGIFSSFLLLGCTSKHIKTAVSETRPEDGQNIRSSQEQSAKVKKPKEDLITGFDPFKDDPENPSPHNPLIKEFGDTPEVRTYIRLKQKLGRGIGLNIDEAIELYTAEAYLYPSDATKANLKRWKKDKERYERLGISMDRPVLRYTGETSHSNGKKTISHPDGSKTIYDSRVEGGVTEVSPQASSAYTDDASDKKIDR